MNQFILVFLQVSRAFVQLLTWSTMVLWVVTLHQRLFSFWHCKKHCAFILKDLGPCDEGISQKNGVLSHTILKTLNPHNTDMIQLEKF
jgi:hypothetical protein